MFFQSLAPLLANRAVLISASDVGNGRIKLTVTPQAIPPKSGEKDDNPALLTPLELEGTGAELDAEMAQNLGPFVESYKGLKTNLEEVKVIHTETAAIEKAAAAQKAAEAKNKNKGGAKTPSQIAAEKAAEKQAEAEKNRPPSLFGNVADEPGPSAPPSAGNTPPREELDSEDEDELDEDAELVSQANREAEIEADIAEARASEQLGLIVDFPATNNKTLYPQEATIADLARTA